MYEMIEHWAKILEGEYRTIDLLNDGLQEVRKLYVNDLPKDWCTVEIFECLDRLGYVVYGTNLQEDIGSLFITSNNTPEMLDHLRKIYLEERTH